MAKYSDEFKVMIVREYLAGLLGYKRLAENYKIKSTTQIKNWVLVYKEYGVEGLFRKESNEVYSVQFKLDVLSFIKRTG
ncbi:transposase, partial [Sporosarcina sp. G11-34]|uniref:transposase n=1 Tax=Sporosarcina sp. G11-34 TaxID=2849605 RepID=UPI0022A8E3B7